MTRRLEIEISQRDGAARCGRVATPRGGFATPCFMPVGTRGSVKAATPADLERLGAEVVLGNTYHLMLRPGAEVVSELGGLGRFSGWTGHTLTDSGGYQVFSLGPKVTDEGATFKSIYDGSSHTLTPEGAVHTQELLGADIQMVLDVCAPLPSSRSTLREALERTALWAARALEVHRRADQSLFGIVQGGAEPDLRRESAERTVALDFDGYGIGGLSVGETRAEMLPTLAAALEVLPPDQPRYLMGVGDPASLVEAVALGVDMFDCVLPTRLGRHGTLLTGQGRLNLKRAEFARSDDPIDARCGCPVCARYSRGYVRHLLSVGEDAGRMICTQHNLAWTLQLAASMREAIAEGRFEVLRSEVLDIWG